MKSLFLLMLIFSSCRQVSMEPLTLKILLDMLTPQEKNTGTSQPAPAAPVQNTPDTTPPSISTGILSFTKVQAVKLDVSWSKASDTVSPQTELKYKIMMSSSNNISDMTGMETSGGGRTLAMDWTKDLSTYTVTGLTVNNTYYFNIMVQDQAGNRTVYTSGSASTKDVYENLDGTVSSYSRNKTYTKCSMGQVWVSTSNDCTGTGSGGDGYGYTSHQYCNIANDSCNPTGPSWDLDGRGNSGVWTVCDQLVLAGKTDWRVMNSGELFDFYQNIYSVNTAYFPRMILAFYFASSANSGFMQNGFASAVNMQFGTQSNLKSKTDSSPMLCVRDGL